MMTINMVKMIAYFIILAKNCLVSIFLNFKRKNYKLSK